MISKTRTGFTFIEILAAMIFMAILLPAIVQGLTIANRVGVAAERQRVATQLADQVLTISAATEEWRRGAVNGDFGDDYPEYSYEVFDEAWTEDTMTLLTARVYYTVQSREQYVQISTLVDTVEVTDEEETL